MDIYARISTKSGVLVIYIYQFHFHPDPNPKPKVKTITSKTKKRLMKEAGHLVEFII